MGLFPSIGLGWVFTEEKFMNSRNGLLSNGKIRFSVGTSGNQRHQSISIIIIIVTYFLRILNWRSNGLLLPTHPRTRTFTWETTKQEDIGLTLV